MFLRSRGSAAGRFSWCVALLLASCGALAHTPGVRTYTEQDGLPSSWVADVTQGADGRMWFLTDAGVVAYDGADWESLDLDAGKALRGGRYFALEDDGGGWAVTDAGGLYKFDGRAWALVDRVPADTTRSQVTDFALLAVGPRSTPVVATQFDGLFVFAGDGWQQVGRDQGLPTNTVHALLVVGDELWIGTDRGLWSWRSGVLTERLVPPGDLTPGVRGLALEPPDSEDGKTARVFLMGSGWAGRLGAYGFEEVARGIHTPGIDVYPRTALAFDRHGGFYFGNSGGLFHFDGHSGRWVELGQNRGLVGGGVLSFHRDRENNLWIATAVGVSKLPCVPFHNLDSADGLFENEVTAVAELSSGTVVLGHNRGLSFYENGRLRTLALPGGSVPRVLDLEADAGDNLWVAGSGLGLLRLSPGGRIEPIGRDDSGEVTAWIYSARFDDDGRLWLGGPEGIYRLEGRRIAPVALPFDDLRMVRRVFRGRGGTLYFATGGSGLLIHRHDRWIQARREGDAAANNVFAVAERDDGRVLVGTHGGLLELRGHDLVRPDERAVPRIDRPVYSLAEDRQGRLWIGTNFGVYRFETGGELRHFSTRQGLAGLETNRAATFVDTSGRVWVGTDRGVSVVDPRGLHPNATAPRVELLGVEARGAPLETDAVERVAYDRNDLAFRVRAISFIDEREMCFRTRLAGLEDDWTVHHATSTRIEVQYPRLPRGRYRFETQARNVQSEWGPVVRSFPIEVLSPFWLRGWFFGLVGGLLILLAAAVHAFVSQRQYAARLEHEVRRHTAALERSRLAIQSEKERLAAVLGNIADGVIALDAGDRVILSNPAAERFLGLGPGAATGRPIREVLAGEDGAAPAPLLAWLRELRDGRARNDASPAVTVAAGSREPRVLEFAAAPYSPSATGDAGIVLAFRDITERRRIEDERARTQRLEALGVLAGGIAHDFNNILTAILGNISLVRQDTPLDAPAEARLQDAEKALARAHGLARQLVTFSKGGAPRTGAVSIEELLRQTARFVFSGSAVRYVVRVSEDLWPAEADPDQIQQVFENLLLNARQAMTDNGDVEIRAGNVDHPPGLDSSTRFVRIDVEDNGRGIRPEDLDRIFEPYFTTKSMGSGLGLATSYSIVQRHGGRMTVRSAPDGTTLSVFLPAARGVPLAAAAGERAATLRRPARVLVLEDEPAVSAVLRDMLASLGHEAVIADDGDAALAACRAELEQGRRFDVAILDLTIRGGRGGAEIVAELDALCEGLPSIASSGYSEGRVMSRFADFGFAAVLPKPYLRGDVDEVIEVARGGRAAKPDTGGLVD